MVHTVPHCCHSSDPRARNQTGLRARSRSGDVGWIREEFSKCNCSCPQHGRALPSPTVPSPCSVVVQHCLEVLWQGVDDGVNIKAHPLQSLLLHRKVLAPGSYLQEERGEELRVYKIASGPPSALPLAKQTSHCLFSWGKRKQTGNCHPNLRLMKRKSFESSTA